MVTGEDFVEFMESVLIVGGGGREHALLKALLRSDRALCIYAYPGNAGMENDGCMIVDRQIDGWEDLANWAKENEIDLTVVGPEIPLVQGIVDIFRKSGLAIFGPSASAARIEGSKEFAKKLMAKYDIPTAAFQTCSSKKAALRYLSEHGAPVVVKVSGLAAGKGAIVCDTMDQAQEALHQIFDRKAFGDAGNTVVLEEKMIGEEASVFVLTDGTTYRILPVAQDHKPVYDGDKGPNTGGMGAYAPAPVVDDALLKRITEEIIEPTLNAMVMENATYKGLLYAGIMITKDGPKVVEFNCRFGDPETEAVLPLVDCDWFEVFLSCVNGTLDTVKWTIKPLSCVTVVCASQGYPGSYKKGKVITGVDKAERNKSNLDVYHAGTKVDNAGDLVTDGGRVLAVTAWAETLDEAIACAYENLTCIEYEGMYFRRDIGAKGLTRLKKTAA
jgi:phosphoribosylamine--glycine ligase